MLAILQLGMGLEKRRQLNLDILNGTNCFRWASLCCPPSEY